MDKVSLPINTRPDIRIFMGEVAIFSILDFQDFAEDIFFSNPTLTADGVPYHSDQVNIEQQGVEINRTDNSFVISSKQHLEKKHANFYWLTSHISEGTLEFTAQFKQRLDVFKQITVKMKNGYSIELYSDGQVRIYIDSKYFDDYFIESNLVDSAAKFRFEFCETRLRILYSVSKDFSKQIELCNVAADFSADDFSIWLTPACHPMYNILYNNYIQLAMPANAAGPNYCHGIGSHKIFNNVLSSFQINYEYLKNYPSCLDFLKENLKKGNYLSIPMDEYYVPNRNAYHKYHFIHGNIVHAFDDEKRTISMLGYKGVTEDVPVSYNEAELGLTSADIRKQYYYDIMIYRKNYRCYPEHFNLKTVIRTLNEYRDGTDTYAHYGNIERHNVKEGRIYGLKIYDEILNKEDVFQKFMQDRRCSYIMGEHKRIMIRRISYFHDTGILTDEEYAIHNSHYTDIAKMAEIMCLSVVRNRIKGREDARNKIYDMLKKLKEKETIAIGLLIRDLKKRI